jgi:propanol-preferring alcohol dehydrogenase
VECELKAFGAEGRKRVMKACVLKMPAPVDSRPLLLADVPAPIPLADEILVRVNACGICRTDLHVVEGELPMRLSPIIPGHQIVESRIHPPFD